MQYLVDFDGYGMVTILGVWRPVECVMVRRIVVAVGLCAGLAVSWPAAAETLTPDEARRFVVGKMFTFNCFEGTRGVGRIYSDGSVAGSVQFQGAGPTRNVVLPASTVKVKGEKVCGSVRGMPFEPCFNLEKIDRVSFRGSLSGMGFAYCDFTHHNSRVVLASSTRHLNGPTPVQSATLAAGD